MVRHHTAEKCERGAERKRMAVRASFLRLANMTKNKWRAGGRAGGDPRLWLLRCVVAVRERGQTRVHQTKNRVDVTVRVTHPHSGHAAHCTRRSVQERREVHEQRTFRTIRTIRRSQSITLWRTSDMRLPVLVLLLVLLFNLLLLVLLSSMQPSSLLRHHR